MKAFTLIALALVACAPQPPLSDASDKKCSIARLGNFIGKPATLAVADLALRISGAKTSRVIGPTHVVTLEYREDRLDIYLDANNRVDHFTCG